MHNLQYTVNIQKMDFGTSIIYNENEILFAVHLLRWIRHFASRMRDL